MIFLSESTGGLDVFQLRHVVVDVGDGSGEFYLLMIGRVLRFEYPIHPFMGFQ